jgi:AraC-like DNA-binding protein
MATAPGGKEKPVIGRMAPVVPVREDYPISVERMIVARVKVGDYPGTKNLLNQLLGTIFLSHPGELDDLKARVVELFAVISRATMEAGAAKEPVLLYNSECIREIMSLDRFETITSWIGPALDRLLDFSRRTPPSAELSVVQRACRFLSEHFGERLSVPQAAQAVYVSPQYLCRLFRRELSTSVMDYLMEIRIDRAKRLLEQTPLPVLEVGKMVGLPDASHFGKVFRRLTGLSPAHYRRQFRRKAR